jgi:flagellar biosynthesis/type III secretory pathway M-ring protein FliF/YscJ
MLIVVRNPMYRIVALGVSLAIAAIIYFAVIKPNNDTANQALRQSEQQVQQAVNQADKQSGGAVPKGVKDLASCMAAAGTDTGKIQACTAKFH